MVKAPPSERGALPLTPLADRPGLFDRLCDDAPEAAFDRTSVTDVETIRERLTRDLTRLLRFKSALAPERIAGTALEGSLLDLAAPDPARFDLSQEGDRDALRGRIQNVLHRHEPRLRRVRVSLTQSGVTALRVSISGLLTLERGETPIRLDAALRVDDSGDAAP
ncbi:MAG: type VI secretion system baseplate subunit TssE [Maricaulaceae bacterium]